MIADKKSNDPRRLDNIRRLAYLVWTIIGIAAIAVACGFVIGQVWTSISVILFSAFLVFILRVPVAWMERHRIPRPAGAAISYLLAFLLIAALLFLVVPVIVEQIIGFVALLPGYVNGAQSYLTELYQQYYDFIQENLVQQLLVTVGSELSKAATDMASGSASFLVYASTSIASGFFVAFVSVVVGFWVLKDLPRISKEVMIIAGPRFGTDVRFIASAFSRSLGGYLKGMMVACLCTGTMAGICYYFIGLPYPLVLGVLTGTMNFIPFLGPWISAITVALLGLFISPLTALLAILGTIVPQQITDNFISPRVMAGTVELHPSIILVVLVAGGALGGIFGMLCAIPLSAAAKAIFVYYFEKRTGRHIISRNGAIFKGRAAPDTDALLNEDAEALRGADKAGADSYLGEKEQRALDAAVRIRKKPKWRRKFKIVSNNDTADAGSAPGAHENGNLGWKNPPATSNDELSGRDYPKHDLKSNNENKTMKE